MLSRPVIHSVQSKVNNAVVEITRMGAEFTEKEDVLALRHLIADELEYHAERIRKEME